MLTKKELNKSIDIIIGKLTGVEERLKVLECSHSNTELVYTDIGHVERCNSCHKILRHLSGDEYHQAKYDELMAKAKEHKKYIKKEKKK